MFTTKQDIINIMNSDSIILSNFGETYSHEVTSLGGDIDSITIGLSYIDKDTELATSFGAIIIGEDTNAIYNYNELILDNTIQPIINFSYIFKNYMNETILTDMEDYYYDYSGNLLTSKFNVKLMVNFTTILSTIELVGEDMVLYDYNDYIELYSEEPQISGTTATILQIIPFIIIAGIVVSAVLLIKRED